MSLFSELNWRTRKREVQALADRVKREGERDKAVIEAMTTIADELKAERLDRVTAEIKSDTRDRRAYWAFAITSIVSLAGVAVNFWLSKGSLDAIDQQQEDSKVSLQLSTDATNAAIQLANNSVTQVAATEKSLDIAKGAVDVARQQASLLKESNDTAKRGLIVNARAWVSVDYEVHALQSNTLSLPRTLMGEIGLKVTETFKNSGSTPATGVAISRRLYPHPFLDYRGISQKVDEICSAMEEFANTTKLASDKIPFWKAELVPNLFPGNEIATKLNERDLMTHRAEQHLFGNRTSLSVIGCVRYATVGIVGKTPFAYDIVATENCDRLSVDQMPSEYRLDLMTFGAGGRIYREPPPTKVCLRLIPGLVPAIE